MWRDLLRSGLVVALSILAGRLAGFVRELLLAGTLGLGRAADLAVFSITLPDAVTGLLMGGAVSAVLVPEFKSHLERSPSGARRLFVQATLLATIAFGLLAAVMAIGGPVVVALLAPGFPAADVPEAADLVALSVVAIPFTAMAGVSTAYLQASGRFAVPALGTLVFNGVIIGALLGWTRPDALLPLAAGVSAAAAARWLSQAGNLALLPRLPDPAPTPRGWTITRGLLLRYVQAMGTLGLVVLAPLVARALASLDAPGSLAALNYVYKIVELPAGIALSVLAIVLLPRFSELFVRGREDEFVLLARQGTWLSWTMAVPLALAMGWFSGPVVSLLFERGAMAPGDIGRIAGLAAAALLALPAMSLGALFFSVLSARGDTARPFRAGVVLFIAYVLLSWLGHRWLGLMGLVWAGVALQVGIAASYAWILTRHHRVRLFSGDLVRDLLVSSLAAVAGIAPFALLGGRDLPAVPGTFLALAAGAVSLGAALLPRLKTLRQSAREPA